MIGGGLPEQARGSQGQAEQSRAEPGSQSKPASWFEVQQKGLERGAVRQREHSETVVLSKAQLLQLVNYMCSQFGPSLL